ILAALKTYKHLPYTFVYLFSFFLLSDGLNTTGTLIAICQNDKFSFSFLQNTYLGLSQAVTSTISTLAFWYIQRYWKISTKKMVCSAIFIRLIYLTMNGKVCCHECCNDFHSVVGYDWNMDGEIWVSAINLSHTIVPL
ncbi:hypothetical protein AZE42_13847, partial [Rhizopogon vesiculosus]